MFPAASACSSRSLLFCCPSVPQDRLLGALVAYRAIYYFAPFAVALALLGVHELWVHRGPAVRVVRLVRTFLTAVTPAGHRDRGVSRRRRAAVLRRHAGTRQSPRPAARSRAAAGAGAVASARQRGRGGAAGASPTACTGDSTRAWWLTIWLLCAGILLSLLKGFDYEEATMLAPSSWSLVSARDAFSAARVADRAALFRPLDHRALLGAATVGWLVLFAYRHVPYDNELWWQFAFQAAAPRSLRASLLAAMIAAAYGLWRVLRPAPPALRRRARRIWSASPAH